jgi:hypothetical protein
MNRIVCWSWAVVAGLGSSLFAAEPGVVTIRGQNPGPAPVMAEVNGPLIGSAPGYGEYKKHSKQDFKAVNSYHDNNFGYEGGYYSGPDGYYSTRHNKIYTYGDAGGGYGDPSCPPNGKDKGPKYGGPKHYTTYEYKWPNNLVYPQYGAPAGMVQYPYYTFRGPTDFFMK